MMLSDLSRSDAPPKRADRPKRRLGVVAVSNIDATGVERADCHGIRVRLR
jgi:hypothetical protein